jgi:hypothetical protein
VFGKTVNETNKNITRSESVATSSVTDILSPTLNEKIAVPITYIKPLGGIEGL